MEIYKIMNKICTSLEQSKKLIELGIDVKTADMCWTNHLFNAFLSSWRIESTPPQEYKNLLDRFVVRGYLIEPAWSLTALEQLMPKIGAHEPMLRKLYYISEPTERYICQYSLTDMTSEYDNPVDACYEMVCFLKENGKI